MTQEHLPSYSSGICRIRSSSGKLICILAAKGSEQKSYQPSSAQCTNSCNVWKSLLNVSNFRHSCWVWLRLNKHIKIIQYHTNTNALAYEFQSHEIHPYWHPVDHTHTIAPKTQASFAPPIVKDFHLHQQITISKQNQSSIIVHQPWYFTSLIKCPMVVLSPLITSMIPW